MKKLSRQKNSPPLNLDSTYRELRIIYNRYRRRYKGNPNSHQMCCMWSINNPPDVLTGTGPLSDMEDAFGIDIDEDAALELYDMHLDEASQRIYLMINQ